QPFINFSQQKAAPVSKEELGRATWTFLHTLAAQYPENPTRQQKKDVKELMAILSRMYPCKECADHFKEVLRSNPVEVGSQAEFSRWMCRVHNVVNRSLGKPVFVCERVDARWGKLDCEQRMCDLEGNTPFGRD
ncbi:FAD-linked sulfhydryl oxidase ERV1, partial [Linum perenne]